MSGKRLRQEDQTPKGRWRWALLPLALLTIVALAVLLFFPGGRMPLSDDADPEPAASAASAAADPEPEVQPDPEPEPEEVPEPEPTEEELRAEQVQQLVDSLTLEEKVAQLFLVTPEQLTGVSGPVTQCGATSRAAIQANCVGGIIYFAANLVDRQQTMDMISGMQEAAPLGLFIAVDEEGGTVSRLGRNSAMGVTYFSDMADVADEEEAYQVGLTLGSELAELGFNLDFAPVADVNSNPSNPVIGVRSFSADPETAARLVAACVSGFQETDTLCTLKHFPGHGDTATDSHLGAATTDKTLEELEACEFLPFQAGIEAGAELVMVGHISVPAVTGDDTPASLSYELVTGLLRQELGFDGLVVTDSLSMGAITQNYGADEAAVLALEAGVDLLLMPESLTQAMDGVLEAVAEGRLTQARIDESVTRILTAKAERGILALSTEDDLA